jgi:hypothetical protein
MRVGGTEERIRFYFHIRNGESFTRDEEAWNFSTGSQPKQKLWQELSTPPAKNSHMSIGSISLIEIAYGFDRQSVGLQCG